MTRFPTVYLLLGLALAILLFIYLARGNIERDSCRRASSISVIQFRIDEPKANQCTKR